MVHPRSLANEIGGPNVVRCDALTRLAQGDRVEDLRRDIRLRERREVDEFPDRCQRDVFSCIFRHLVEAFGVGVGGMNDLVASDAIDPVAHATKVAVDSDFSMTIAHGHLLERIRLQSMHVDPCQEARGAEMTTSVTRPSQRVVLGKGGNPVEEVHHAGNHEQARLLHRLRAVRAVRSWQLLDPDWECEDREAEVTPSVPRRASCDCIGRAVRHLLEWRSQLRVRLWWLPALQSATSASPRGGGGPCHRRSPFGSYGTSSLQFRAA